VLCDLGLPRMGGLEVCQRIRARPSAVQPIIVAVTGWRGKRITGGRAKRGSITTWSSPSPSRASTACCGPSPSEPLGYL
jgi:DNA-binding NarL/FixJ family response regulator